VRRATNDIFEVCTNSTSNYLYYNNSSVFGHINVTNSNNSWFINSSGLGSFPSISTTTANITTDNVGTLNVSGTAAIATNLCIGSTTMRTNSDRLNVSTTSTGPYMFFNDGGTLGTYDTTNLLFPWFVEMTGYGKFTEISYKNEQVDNNIITSASYNVSLTTKKMTLLACTTAMTVNLTILMPSICNNNIFEFRVLTSASITFTCSAQGAIIIDLANNQQRNLTYSANNYFRFYYTYYNNLYTYILLELR
jgi:hypothetical protein